MSCCTWSTIVRWCPSPSAAIVTQLVTRLQARGQAAPRCELPACTTTGQPRQPARVACGRTWQRLCVRGSVHPAVRSWCEGLRPLDMVAGKGRIGRNESRNCAAHVHYVPVSPRIRGDSVAGTGQAHGRGGAWHECVRLRALSTTNRSGRGREQVSEAWNQSTDLYAVDEFYS